MIINGHVHLLEMRLDDALPTGIAVLQKPAAILPLLRVEEALRQMDAAGIERSALYAVDAPIVYASNEYVSEICQRYPDRFIGMASVDVHREDAVSVLRRAVTEMGMKGFKFHPPLQNFFPNAPLMDPIYELARELDVPVIFHTGTTPFGKLAQLQQANPILLDDVACRFPELRILLTHLGTLWHNEAMMVVEKNPNVFVDTAEYPPWIEKLLTPEMVERVGPDKIVFGTDYPMPYRGESHNMEIYVDCVKNLPLSASVIQKIFCDNFMTLLEGRPVADELVTGAELLRQAGGTV